MTGPDKRRESQHYPEATTVWVATTPTTRAVTVMRRRPACDMGPALAPALHRSDRATRRISGGHDTAGHHGAMTSTVSPVARWPHPVMPHRYWRRVSLGALGPHSTSARRRPTPRTGMSLSGEQQNK